MFRKNIAIILVCVLFGGMLTACAEKDKTDYSLYAGTYSLLTVTLGADDITDQYGMYQAILTQEKSMKVTISFLGVIENRESEYSFKNGKITENYRGTKYIYSYDAISDTLTYSENQSGEQFTAVLKKQEQTSENGEVDFEGILFGEDRNIYKYFNYCPAIIQEEEDGKTVMHIWYCANPASSLLVDNIAYRKGTRQQNGKWIFGEQKIVLTPTADTWDDRHTCDPAVIRGKFNLKGTEYKYLMSYLGCMTDDYSNNETGLAVANNPEGPWIKLDELNPIVPCLFDGKWGTGMPALLSIDGAGEVLLFVQSTVSTTGATVQRWDFSNLSNPLKKGERDISRSGIKNYQGTSGSVGQGDYAFDPVKKRLYCITESHTKLPADITKTVVPSHQQLIYIEGQDDMEAVSRTLLAGDYTWKSAGYIGPDLSADGLPASTETGFPRNHNCGIVRDANGYIIDSGTVPVVVATGFIDWPNDNIFTYRLRGVNIVIK